MALGRATEVFLGQGVRKDQVHSPIPMTGSSGLVITPLDSERAVCPCSPTIPPPLLSYPSFMGQGAMPWRCCRIVVDKAGTLG